MEFLTHTLWPALLVVLFFGGSIFVHELGHFLAARWRGLKIERFSIGFGPKIAAWRGRDGVEYRLSWLPLGGYVALPQLADLRGIEGEASSESAALPPISYTSKMVVAVAGAVFNVLFAFLLATVVWLTGQPQTQEDRTTRIGYVAPTLPLANGQTGVGPGFAAGLQAGDIVRKVDGRAVTSFPDIETLVALGWGRDAKNEPRATLTIEREGQLQEVTVRPLKIGPEQIRYIGIEAGARVMVGRVTEGSAAAAAGLKAGDLLTHLDGRPVEYAGFISEYLKSQGGRPVRVEYLRGETPGSATVQPRLVLDLATQTEVPRLGVELRPAFTTEIVRVTPWEQLRAALVTTGRTFASLLHPKSDIGLNKMSGPIGIAERIYVFSQTDLRLMLVLIVVINLNLAVFNLLPIPVLDGGHMLFATVAKLRGRALSPQFVAATQGVFMLLLLCLVLYVSVFDTRRIVRNRESAPPPPAPAEPAAPVAPIAPVPTPAQP